MGGRTLMEHCPTCDRTTRLHEVEVTEAVGVWFVDVVDDTERAFRCSECGETFDLREKSAAPANPPPKSGMARVEELAAEQRRRDAAASARRAEVETRIDDELAELKKRMGRQ